MFVELMDSSVLDLLMLLNILLQFFSIGIHSWFFLFDHSKILWNIFGIVKLSSCIYATGFQPRFLLQLISHQWWRKIVWWNEGVYISVDKYFGCYFIWTHPINRGFHFDILNEEIKNYFRTNADIRNDNFYYALFYCDTLLPWRFTGWQKFNRI